ncbi:MAG: protein required for attachment to host cells [Candidatus Midichloriaceae bacterium]|jgi:protein required for attachment to host cells
MTNKLILVIDAKFAKLYTATGLKMEQMLSKFSSDELINKHKKHPVKDGFNGHAGGSSHFFDPHTDHKDLDRNEFGKKIFEIIINETNNKNYSEIILIAEHKMLHIMRKHLANLKHIDRKEIAKDLVHAKDLQIEKVAFS